MHIIDLTRGPRRGGPARRLLVVAVPVVAAVAVLGASTVAGGGGPSGSPRSGPTAEVATRDLATTLTEQGALRRSGEQIVSYAGALTPDGSDTPAADTPDTPERSDGPAVTPASYVTPRSATTSAAAPSASSTTTVDPTLTPSSSTPSSSTTSTTSDPCASGGSSSTTSSTSPTSTTECPPTPTTTQPTVPTTPDTPTTTSTTVPSGPDAPAPDGPDGRPSDPSPDDGGPDGDDGLVPPDRDRTDSEGGPEGPPGDGPVTGDGNGGVLPSGDDQDADVIAADSAVLTSVTAVGSTAGPGTVLYTADDQPVVALLGDLPAWRTLEVGVAAGADVRQLEDNLVVLGYGGGLDVDEAFTAGTAAAVEAWETELGRTAPDGVVAIGDVVFLSAPGDVLGHEASVGVTLDPGAPVLTIGAEQRVVLAQVDATSAGGWPAGSVVVIEWADGTTAEGMVFGTGRDVSDGEVDLVVAVDAAAAGGRRSGAKATFTLVDARRDGVLAVPVAALVDDDGAPAVRVVRDGGPDELVPVATGLVAGGWVEITDGVEAEAEVRLPG